MNYNSECGNIVFAKTRGKARSLALGAPGFESAEFVDFDVCRIKKLDGRKESEGVMDWDESQLYYEAGWYPSPETPQCDLCSRYQYDDIPESHVEEDPTNRGAICAGCKAEHSSPIPTLKGE